MPQGRIILKSISESKKLADLKTDGARLLYTWLITHLDVNGNFSADPDVVNGKVFTRLKKTTKTVESYLDDLESNKLIIRYTANGDIFLSVPNFEEKQPNLRRDRESPGTIPKFNDIRSENTIYFKKALIPISLIKQVVQRDGNICQICGKEGIYDEHFKHFVIEKEKDVGGREIAFEIDHIYPEYLGGKTELDNLRLVCRKCNRSKGVKIENSGGTPAEPQKTPTQVKISKVKVSKGKEEVKETKSHSSTSTERILSAWQKLPLSLEFKAISPTGLSSIDRAVSELTLHPVEPIAECDIIAAIENYGRALKLPDSQTHKHKLIPWLRNHIRKTYLDDVFNIENHKRSNFQKDTQLKVLTGKFCGKCGMPAVYKSIGDFDHFYCAEHMPAKVKDKYC